MQFPESNNIAMTDYHETTNLTYISNLAQLERQLQAIELSYMTEKVPLDLKDGGDSIGDGQSDEDKEELQPETIKRLQSVTRGAYNLIKSNVGLLLLLLVYTLMGAAVFAAIEGRDGIAGNDHGTTRRKLVEDIFHVVRSQILNGSISLVNSSDDDEYHSIEELIMRYEEALLTNPVPGNRNPGRDIPWTYWGALYFCATVFTTVGYGNIYPRTNLGMVVTMIYAAIGIPLCLVVLSKLGKSLTRLIKFFWSYIRRFYYTGSFQRVRRMIPVSRFRRSLVQRIGDHIRRGTIRLRRSRSSEPQLKAKDDLTFVPYEIDDKFNLPPVIAISIAFLYIVLGAFLYNSWENWTYLESFYFTFISLCTIGFGDIVPDHPKFFLASSVYLLFGLALVAMVITVIMETVSDTINKATERVIHVGERIIQFAPRQCLAAERGSSFDMNGNGIRRKSV